MKQNISKQNVNLKIKKKNKFLHVNIIIGLLLGFGLGVATMYFIKPHTPKPKNTENDYIEVREGGYKYISPLLECDNFHPVNTKYFAELKNELANYVNNAIYEKNATHISVYYRSLNNGPWFGIKEHEYFTPASLLKVPILIAALKKAENDNTLLNRKFLYKTSFGTEFQNILGNEQVKLGTEYTFEELLNYMIIQSDNEAKELIIEIIGNDYIVDVMEELGLNLKSRDLNLDFVTVKEYSSFFRILYNASYLNRNMSEKALEMMSKTLFNKGIKGKLPPEVMVAHKFGERGYDDVDFKQLHDCGIIYLTGSPYLLCVMTKGNDFDKLTSIIADISLIVYNNQLKNLNSKK